MNNMKMINWVNDLQFLTRILTKFIVYQRRLLLISSLLMVLYTEISDQTFLFMKMIAEFSNANKGKEIEQRIKKDMSKKQLSGSTLLFRQGAMS